MKKEEKHCHNSVLIPFIIGLFTMSFEISRQARDCIFKVHVGILEFAIARLMSEAEVC